MKTYKTLLGLVLGLTLLCGPTFAQTSELPAASEYTQWLSQRSELWNQELTTLRATPGVSASRLQSLEDAMESAQSQARALASAPVAEQKQQKPHLAASIFLVERQLEYLLADPSARGTLAAED